MFVRTPIHLNPRIHALHHHPAIVKGTLARKNAHVLI